MYKIEFYETITGQCDILDFLDDLRKKSSTSKDARIQYQQAARHIWLLQENGTHLPTDITKHLVDDIWELRPGNNRVLFFFFKNNTYVLLHHFRKKTQKTPRREIERAIAEKKDYLSRKEHNHGLE